ncbi:nucleotidyl cyclase domain-containing protein [Actinophytocola sediminis]
MKPLTKVDLLLGNGVRSYHASDIPFGSVTFHGMRIDALTDASAEQDAYLIKVNYDIEFEPEAPPPMWAEIGIRFTSRDILVHDALPRSVSEPIPPTRYAVTTQLSFIPFEPDMSGRVLHDHVPLPAITPIVECLEIGSPGVRWRRRGDVGAGSHVGWLTVVTPAGCQELAGKVVADYALQSSDSLGVAPRKGQNDGFTLRLPSSAVGAGISMRLGFTVDIVSYTTRTIRKAEQLQTRLLRLVHKVMADAGVPLGERDIQGTGDGLHGFFPPDTDPTRALNALLTALPQALSIDNRARDGDEMQLRMAIDHGTVGLGPLGFTADAVINFCRLVDSAPIRDAVTIHPDASVVVLVSEIVYNLLITRFDKFAATNFEKVDVVVKNYQAPAYLMIPKERS